MGRVFVVRLEGKIYSCKYCGTHLGLSDDVISKSFQSSHGKAYLFNKVPKIFQFDCDSFPDQSSCTLCSLCGSIVGWKYEIAHEMSQKYKEGKSVLERFKISGPDGSNYWVSREAHAVGGSDTDDA